MTGAKGRRPRRNGVSASSNTQILRGHHTYQNTSIVTGTAQLSFGFQPLLFQSGRLLEFAGIYEKYRVRKLKFTFCLAGTGANIWLGYLPTVRVDNLPLTAPLVSECDKFRMSVPGVTYPVTLRLNESDLHGSQDYYDTTTAGAEESTPGTMIVTVYSASTGLAVAALFTLFVEWEYEFYGPVNQALTISRLRERLAQIEDSESDTESVIVTRKKKPRSLS
jgi:hypothetical protein